MQHYLITFLPPYGGKRMCGIGGGIRTHVFNRIASSQSLQRWGRSSRTALTAKNRPTTYCVRNVQGPYIKSLFPLEVF